jgi:outer membrane protein assembly factor BamB
MNNTPFAGILLFSTAVCASQAVNAQEWTRFRGPNGTGISNAKGIPTELSAKDVVWKSPLPGMGHSSPVVWGQKVFLTSTGDKEGGFSALCLGATNGAILWKHDFPLTPFTRHKFNSFASATPAVTSEAVFVVWNEPDHYYAAALDHSGKLLWQRDLGPFVSQHACGTSPVVDGTKLILGAEQDNQKNVPGSERNGESFLIALDTKTGETIWKTPRESAVVAYSTPCIYEPKTGGRALIFNGQAHGISAIDPGTGAVLWEHGNCFSKRSVSSPLVAGDIIFGSCGSGGGGNYVVAIRAPGATAGGAAVPAYELRNAAPYVPTGVVKDGLGWFWSDGGMLLCIRTATGEEVYKERVGGNFFGSPVWISGRLFCVSTSGQICVVEASEKFNVMHRFELEELCHSTPAVAGGRLFVRTEKHLVCMGGAPKAAAAATVPANTVSATAR